MSDLPKLFAADPTRPGAGYVMYDRGDGPKAYRVEWSGNSNPAAGERVALPGQRYLLDAGDGTTFEGPEIDNDDLYQWLTTYHAPDAPSDPATPVVSPAPVTLPPSPTPATIVDQVTHDAVHEAVTQLAKVTPPDSHGWLWTIAHALRLV